MNSESPESARASFLKLYSQEGPRGKYSWWSRQPKMMKFGMIAGSVVIVALLVILPFWSSWFGSDDVRTLNMSQEKQYVKLTLESLEYVSSPRDSSRVVARFSVFGNWNFDVSAVVSQGQDRHTMLTSQTTGGGGMRWVGTVYFDHFDIAGSSRIEVTLSEGTSREYVFEIPAK